jgi:1-acyl-sn-glycerol-3-phosphate acyltransferase
MSQTWHAQEPKVVRINRVGWLRIVVRAVPLALLVFGCLALLLVVRLIERPIWGQARPITPWITQFVCRGAFFILGMGFSTSGTVMRHRGAVVANHSSWLDIFTLNASNRIYFVSKSEVSGWPGIGWLARATGTVFIRRNPRDAAKHRDLFSERLLAGHRLLFFPEGTSTDGRQVIAFKPTLFAAFFEDALRDTLYIQPATVCYTAPEGTDPRHYGWWGDMEFGPHFLSTLATPRQGRVEVKYHAPIKVSDFANRKVLAAHLQTIVAGGLT